MWFQHDLDENLLLHLDAATLAAIFSLNGPRDGQKRVNQLFRLVQRRIVRREVVLTVARQKDGPRRARMAREPRNLGREGIVVLGHYEWDLDVADRLALPRPRSGEWISIRVHPGESISERAKFFADGRHWALAGEDEPPVQAPTVPRSKALGPAD